MILGTVFSFELTNQCGENTIFWCYLVIYVLISPGPLLDFPVVLERGMYEHKEVSWG